MTVFDWFVYICIGIAILIVLRLGWMFMGPVSVPAVKEVRSPEPDIGTFRIIPYEESQFKVEQYNWIGGDLCRCMWQTEQKEYKHKYPSNCDTTWRNYRYYIDLIFDTEREAEEYVRTKLNERAGVEAAKLRKVQHAKMYPPREIPPFKYGTE